MSSGSAIARDFLKDLSSTDSHEPLRYDNSFSSNPKYALARENSTSSVLSNTFHHMNPFSQQQDAPIINLMDTSLARYSHSESAPMGQGQLMGNHARRTRGDVELGMEDIWLDGGGAGRKGSSYRNPHDGTKKRQRLLFWGLILLVTTVTFASIVHRTRGGADHAPTSEAPLAVALTEAPSAAAATATNAPVGPEKPTETPQTEPAPTLAPTGNPTAAAGENGAPPEVGVENQEGQGLDNLEGEGDNGDTPVEEVEQEVDVNEEAEGDINQVIDLLDGEITEIKEAEVKVTEEMDTTQDEQTLEELQEEETILEYEEQAALDEVEVMQQMNSVQTAEEVDLLSQEGDVLEKEMANLAETAELLEEEANAETPEEFEEASSQVGQLEDEETNLEGQQAAINEEVDQALQQDGGDGA